MAKTKVAVVKGPKKPSEKEIEASVRKAIELAGGLADIVKRGDTVIIKPNIVVVQSQEEGAANTDPRICKVIANMVRELGAKPIIGEASSIGQVTADAIQKAGYGKLREEGYPVIDFTKEEAVKVPVPKGKKLKEVTLPRIVLDADVLIDVPKMKTHDQTEVTLALKNMKGILYDKGKRSLHHTYGIFEGVADLCTVVKPALSVVDGIIAMEGLGPMAGDIVEMGLIIAGKDPVAVDTVTAKIMGFKPEDHGCIGAAVAQGIGVGDLDKIEVVGEPIAKVQRRFKRAAEAMGELPFPEDFQLLMDERACTGCRNTVTEVLLDVNAANQLDRAAGWSVVVGKLSKLPEVDRAKLLLVGACTTRFKKEGIYVEGCPPNNRDVCNSLRNMGIDVISGIDLSSVEE